MFISVAPPAWRVPHRRLPDHGAGPADEIVSARIPRMALMASMMIDLPAPVSRSTRSARAEADTQLINQCEVRDMQFG